MDKLTSEPEIPATSRHCGKIMILHFLQGGVQK